MRCRHVALIRGDAGARFDNPEMSELVPTSHAFSRVQSLNERPQYFQQRVFKVRYVGSRSFEDSHELLAMRLLGGTMK